jgi:acyl carrier protein
VAATPQEICPEGFKRMESLIAMFARILELDPQLINDQSSPETLQNWDSLKFMQLISEFESEYKINLDINSITQLKTFADFKKILQDKK